MNSCVLMADIIQEPQLRYTADNLAVTEMLVQFPNSIRPEDPPATLKVVGWGNLATEIQHNYHEGDRVILVGRLGMNTIERPEGFKEKRAELTVQQIQNVGVTFKTTSPAPARTPAALETPAVQPVSISQPQESYQTVTPTTTPTTAPATTSVAVTPQVRNPEPAYQPTNFERTSYTPATEEEPDPDDIPFMRPVHSRNNMGNELYDSFELEANSYWGGIKEIKP